MTDPVDSDHWGSLASSLGATPSPEPADPASGHVETTSEVAGAVPASLLPKKKVSKRTAETPRSATNWESLASSLGIAPHPMPSSQASEVEVSDTLVEPTPLEREVDWIEEATEAAEDPAKLLIEPVDEGEAPRESPLEEKKAGRRRRKRRRRPRDAGEAGASPAAVSAQSLERGVESPEEASEADGESDSEVEPSTDSGEVLEHRAGRRREHRGGRKKSRRGRAKGSDEQESLVNDAARRDERPQRSDQAQDHVDREFDEAGDVLDEGGKEGKIGHRSIPTWEEAVGLVIAANMEARAKRPSTASRGHGQGRGSNGGRRPRNGRDSGGRSSRR